MIGATTATPLSRFGRPVQQHARSRKTRCIRCNRIFRFDISETHLLYIRLRTIDVTARAASHCFAYIADTRQEIGEPSVASIPTYRDGTESYIGVRVKLKIAN